MWVKTKIRFRDSENELRTRKENESFEVTKERAEYLAALGLVEIQKEEKEEKK